MVIDVRIQYILAEIVCNVCMYVCTYVCGIGVCSGIDLCMYCMYVCMYLCGIGVCMCVQFMDILFFCLVYRRYQVKLYFNQAALLAGEIETP